jgi:hypothetical protein
MPLDVNVALAADENRNRGMKLHIRELTTVINHHCYVFVIVLKMRWIKTLLSSNIMGFLPPSLYNLKTLAGM